VEKFQSSLRHRSGMRVSFLQETLVSMIQNDQEKYPMNILAKRLNKLVDKSADDLRDMVSKV